MNWFQIFLLIGSLVFFGTMVLLFAKKMQKPSNPTPPITPVHPTPAPAHAAPAAPANHAPAAQSHPPATGHKKSWWKMGLWALLIVLVIVLIRMYGSDAIEFCGLETPKSGTVLATVRNFFGGSWGWILIAFLAIWIFLMVSWGWRIFILVLMGVWFWWAQPAEPIWVEVYEFSNGVRKGTPSAKKLVPFTYDLQRRVEFEVIGGKAVFDFPHYGETTFSPGEKCNLPKGSVYKGKTQVRRARWWD